MTAENSDFLRIFRAEADERLDHFTAALDAIEAGRADTGTVDSIYRDMHTIKGAAGMLELDEVREIAEAVEKLLDTVRPSKEFPVDVLGPLRQAADSLRDHVHARGGETAALLDELARAREGGRARVAPSARPKILVVEDSASARELLRKLFEAAGHRVETASDGRQALEQLASDREIGLVVTDIEMPGMDGFELIRSIRSRRESSELPVVVVTSRGSDDDRTRGLEAGADLYIAKAGFDQRALLEAVRDLVGS